MQLSRTAIVDGLGEYKPTAWLRNRPTQFLCGLHPFLRNAFDSGKCFGFRLSIRRTTGKFGDFSDKRLIVFTPIDYDFVLHVTSFRASDHTG